MDKKITIRVDEATYNFWKNLAKADYRSLPMWILHKMETLIQNKLDLPTNNSEVPTSAHLPPEHPFSKYMKKD